MPYKEIQIEKVYFTIGEVAAQFGINPSMLRYWESEFTHLQPKKSRKGDRLYTKADIEQIRVIHHLLKEKGLTIEGARKHLKDNKNVKENFQTLESLQKIRKFLIGLKDALQ